MEAGLSVERMVAMFVAMVAMAGMPSLGVLTVVSRTATGGLRQGLDVALGIVLADLLFILLAVAGLALVAEAAGPFFPWVKGLGGLYLLWLGFTLWRTGGRGTGVAPVDGLSPASSLGAGFTLTLGDHKAILFYLGFLPAFVDLAALSPGDILGLLLVAAVAVGTVKSFYALLAWHFGRRLPEAASAVLNRLASIALMVVGLGLLAWAVVDWE